MQNPSWLPVFLIFTALTLDSNADACTIVSAIGEKGGVWNANNEDSGRETEELFLNVYPKNADSEFGFTTLTYDQPDSADIQGGMNEAGLTIDFNALNSRNVVRDRATRRPFPMSDDKVLPYLLGRFETVEDVVRFLNHHRFESKEVFSNCQMHLADRRGHFAIVSPTGSRVQTQASSLVSTNFDLCRNEGDVGCERFVTATKILQSKSASLASLRAICAATAQTGRFNTLYSNIQNLTTGDVWFYARRNFFKPFKTNIRDLLASGRRSWRIRDLCDGSQLPLCCFEDRLPGLIADYQIPTVAVAVVDPTLESPLAFVCNHEIAARKHDLQSIFNMASLTKPVFTMMALQLVANGKLDLDEKLHELWTDPDVADSDWASKLTPRLLLSHQSGFPNWRSGKLRFEFEPGMRTQYSGEGFDYLRKAIEHKTSMGMSHLAKLHVLGPAKMHDTHFGWNESIKDRFVLGTQSIPGRPLKHFDLTGLAKRGPSGAGSMFATIVDYGKFLQWIVNDPNALPDTQLREMRKQQGATTNAGEAVGLGWHLTKANGKTLAYHEGREDGIYNLCMLDFVSRRTVVVLTNSTNGSLAAERILASTLPEGREFVDQKSQHIVKAVSGLRGKDLDGVVTTIASSPSYTKSLLLGFALAAKNGQNPSKELRHLLDAFAKGLVSGEIGSDSSAVLVRQITNRLAKSQGPEPSDIGWLAIKMKASLQAKHQ